MYKCKICEKEFEKAHQLSGHGNAHSVNKKEKYPCKICGKTFNKSSQLKGHLSSHSRGSRYRKLRQTDKSIKRKTQNKIHKCRYCGKVYDSGVKLGGHTSSCNLNPASERKKIKLSKFFKGRKLTEETKKKISISRKKYLDENPGQIPYLLNHSSKESYPEKLFREKLEEEISGWVQEYPYKRYSLDFAFVDKKIDVEIDGGTHNLPHVKKIDEERDKTLKNDGWVVYRISVYDVKNNLDEKIRELKQIL